MKKTSHNTPHPRHEKQKSSDENHCKDDCNEPSEVTVPATPEPIDLQEEVNKYRDQAMRAVADLENYRKRMIREKEDAVRYANRSLLEKLLPILDNFELGLEAAKASASKDAEGILSGLGMVQRQLIDFLNDHGLTPINAEGTLFDPKFHDAIGHEPHESLAEGHVIKQIRRGYQLADRLLRPATVIVSKGQEAV